MISLRDNIITMLRGADPSTFLHESAHSWLEDIRLDALRENAPPQLIKDWNTIKKWAGIPENLGPDQMIPRAAHEKFAQGIEQYFRKGIAPSIELRPVFARFKDWLVRIYRTGKELGVEITPEISDVMDRLLATDDQIARARESAEFSNKTILPPDWMTTAEKGALEKLIGEAKEQAETRVRTELMNELVRERTEFWKSEKKNVTEEVTAEVDIQPVYLGLSALRTGKMPDGTEIAKLSREAIVAQYGADYLKTLPKPFIFQMEGGLHPDVAAEMFGFDTGKEMLTAMINAPSRKDAIASEVDARMMERHGDMMNDGSLAERAADAVVNDKQLSVYYREMQILLRNGATGNLMSLDALKEMARGVIDSKKVRELTPQYYEAAAAKAGRDVARAGIAGKINSIFEGRQRQILNMIMFRETSDAKKEINKSLRAWKLISRPDKKLAKSRDMDMVNAARAMLANHGITTADRSAMDYMALIKEYDEPTYNSMIPLIEAADFEKPFRDLTMSEYRMLKDAVDGLWNKSRTANQLMIDGRRVEKEQVKEELFAGAEPFIQKKVQEEYEKAVTDKEKRYTAFLGLIARFTRVEHWVHKIDLGNFDGPFRRYIYTQIRKATSYATEREKIFLQKYLEIMKDVEKTFTVDKIKSDELKYTFGVGEDGGRGIFEQIFDVGKQGNGSGMAELFGAMMHRGNQSNFQKLVIGYGWGSLNEDGSLDSSRWDAFIQRLENDGTITKNHWDALQKIWDLMEELKPDAQKAHKEIYGYYFAEITANPFQTKFGTYKGGYFPAKTDPWKVDDAQTHADMAALDAQQNSIAWPTSGRGATMTRVKGYNERLALDMGLAPQHIRWAVQFSFIEPRVREVHRLLMDKEVKAAIGAIDPTVIREMLIPWLQRSAKQQVTEPATSQMGRTLGAIGNELRRRTGAQIMVMNVTNTIQQFTGLALGKPMVRKGSVTSALWKYMRNPESTTELIAEKSEMMRNLVTTSVFEVQNELEQLLTNPTKYEQARGFARQHGYFLQTITQGIVNKVMWWAAYNQALGEVANEDRAREYGNAVVRMTQGTFDAVDLSQGETGAAWTRTIMMFASYFNMQANLLGSENVIAGKIGGAEGFRRRFMAYTAFMATAVASELIVQLASGEFFEDDDEDYWLMKRMLDIFFFGQIRTAFALVPVVGQVPIIAMNTWNKRYYDDRLSTSPIVSIGEAALSAPASIYNATVEGGSIKKAVKDSLALIGMATGLPVMWMGRPLGYMADVEQGKTEPKNTVDYVRGLVSGRSAK